MKTSTAIVLLAGLLIAGMLVAQVVRINKGGQLSQSILRISAIAFVAAVGGLLAVTDLESDARSGAYALLGTLGGFLAGRTDNPPSPKEAD